MNQNSESINCQQHQLPILIVDMNPKCDQNCKYFCAFCLITNNSIGNPFLLDDANYHFQKYLNAQKEKVSAQTQSKLQILRELESILFSIKQHYIYISEKIQQNIVQQRIKMEETLKNQMEKLNTLNIDSFLKEPQDFLFNVNNIDLDILQTQLDYLYNQERIEAFSNKLKQLDLIKFNQAPETPFKAQQIIDKKRTSYLLYQCEQHQKEIIFFGLRKICFIETNNAVALCAECVSTQNFENITDIGTIRRFWNEQNEIKKQILMAQTGNFKQKIEYIQIQIKQRFEQISFKIKQTNQYLKQILQKQLEINNFQINKLNQDFYQLSKMEIELITQSFLNPLICKQPSDPAKIASIKIMLLGNSSECIVEQFYFEPFPKNSYIRFASQNRQLKGQIMEVDQQKQANNGCEYNYGIPRLKKNIGHLDNSSQGDPMFWFCAMMLQGLQKIFLDVQSFFEMKVLLQMARESIFDETILDVLVAIKIDPEEQRQISKLDGQIFAEENDLQYYEVSAKDWWGVQEIFLKIAQYIIEQQQKGLQL